MNNRRIKLNCYFRHVLKESDNIDDTLMELLQEFPKFKDYIIDLYILIKEQYLNIHQQQIQDYRYDTMYNKQNYKIKTQKDIIEKLKLNLLDDATD